MHWCYDAIIRGSWRKRSDDARMNSHSSATHTDIITCKKTLIKKTFIQFTAHADDIHEKSSILDNRKTPDRWNSVEIICQRLMSSLIRGTYTSYCIFV